MKSPIGIASVHFMMSGPDDPSLTVLLVGAPPVSIAALAANVALIPPVMNVSYDMSVKFQEIHLDNKLNKNVFFPC